MSHLITLEEHYVSKASRSTGAADPFALFPKPIVTKLENLGDERIQDLDKGEVSLQVISHGPYDGHASTCIAANNELAEAISKNPKRLAGFAMLPMIDPKAAADELSRCVKELGFVGTLLDNHLDGKFYDDEHFWSIFQKAEELDVPVYLHPTFASDEMLEHYKGNYDDMVALGLSAFGWGWHSETGLHILRLFASGLFDRYPKLKIIIGHMGELLPFQLDRCIAVSERWGKKERGLGEVWKKNIWVTTSGMFTLTPLECLLKTTTVDHVLYSVDYPFSSNEKGKEFFEVIRESKLFSEEELEMFAYRNAEKLLKVKAT